MKKINFIDLRKDFKSSKDNDRILSLNDTSTHLELTLAKIMEKEEVIKALELLSKT